MAKRPSISAVIAAGNEEQMIRPCLDLLDFVDEIVVVVDAASTDRTESIAKRYTKKVFRRRLESFAKQKNFGINKADSEWILIVDADERITPALTKEIKAVTANPDGAVGFNIRRTEFFFGRQMRHGAWEERILRLIKKSYAHYVRDIHEIFEPPPTTEIKDLREPMWHFSNRSIGHHLAKLPKYVEIHSEQMLREGHPPVTVRSFFSVVGKSLWFRLIRHRAYRDGPAGVIQSFYWSFSLFCAYARLWEKQRRQPLVKTYEGLEKQVRRRR